MGTPAKCLPVSTNTVRGVSYAFLICDQSGSALGATWDPALIEGVGLKLLAGEAKLRAASLVLAPTCNIPRVSRPLIVWVYSDIFKQNPLGGRAS